MYININEYFRINKSDFHVSDILEMTPTNSTKKQTLCFLKSTTTFRIILYNGQHNSKIYTQFFSVMQFYILVFAWFPTSPKKTET
jgi:hypothetical protein